MKLNPDIPNHCSIIAKYLAQEMTVSEAKEFETIVNSHPENMVLVEDFRRDWKQIGNITMKKPNVDKAWQNLSGKLKEEDLVGSVNVRPLFNQMWLRATAAVVVILVATSAFLFTNLLNQSVTIQSSAEPTTLVHSLTDGSVIYLEPNTTITYAKRFGRRSRSISLDGDAFFEVAHNTQIPFVVETTNAQVQVLGTSFTVRAGKDSIFEVLVQTGSVNVESKARKAKGVVALAGDRVTLANSELTKISGVVSPESKYKTSRLQFKDEQLSSIVQVLNKTFGSNIIVDTYQVGSRRLTVTFVDSSIDSMVEVICAALGLEAKYENSTITLWQP